METAIEPQTKVVVYGGNGFVGTHVAKELSQHEGVCTVCLSRTGHKPVHLKDEKWSQEVRWCKGDASAPDTALLATSDVLISVVGSPPLPTFSAEAYEQQVFSNGTTNVNAIEAAGRAGIDRVVLLGAKIPFFMKTDRFGYSKGKRLAFEAAEKFSATSAQHSAVVLQPGVIYGTRHLESGRAVALGPVLKPFSHVMPWQFVSVEQVAARIADAVLNSDQYENDFTVLSNREI